jgi:hypothetical protein
MNCCLPVCLASWLLAAAVALADIDAVQELGLRPNAPTFDNGKIITQAIAAGRITDTLHFPGGIYYHTTPIVLARDSLALTGQGISRWRRAGAFEKTAAAIFLYRGPAEEPAWKISGHGVALRGLNIWRGFYGAERQGIGVEWSQWGRRDIAHCSFAGWDIDWRLAPSNHNDCTTVTNVAFSGRVCIRGEESQASGIDFRGIWVNSPGDVFCELIGNSQTKDRSGGGNWHFSTLVLNEERLLLRLATGANTSSFSIENLKVDNNAAGWRLLEMTKPGPLNLRVRGHIGQRATMGERPIVLGRSTAPGARVPDGVHELDIELWGPNPSGQRVWRPSLDDAR